jgi:hypothetical protein
MAYITDFILHLGNSFLTLTVFFPGNFYRQKKCQNKQAAGPSGSQAEEAIRQTTSAGTTAPPPRFRN